MDHGPPPLFNQGVSARARLAFFSFLAIALIIVDARVQALDTVRAGVGVVLYPVQRLLLLPREAASAVGEYFATKNRLVGENEELRREAVEQALRAQQAAALEAENAQLRRLLGASDLAQAAAFEPAADMLIFDAKPPAGGLPESPRSDLYPLLPEPHL